MSRRKKAIYSVFVCVAFVGLLELMLAMGGVSAYRDVRDPFLDFAGGIPLFVRSGDSFETNELKLTYFNRQRFDAQKQAGAYRIFCLGGSTTFGHPYADSTSYVGWLRLLLTEFAPGRKWEVVNCGGISYASYRLAALTQELVHYQPDLFVFYEGHNEFLEERTYHDIRERNVVMRGAIDIVSRLRLAAVAARLLDVDKPQFDRGDRSVLPGEVDTILDHSYGPRSYRRDRDRQRKTEEHFENSIARICRLARQAGAETVFISPASNLKDFSPFKSEPSVEELSSQSQIRYLAATGIAAVDQEDLPAALTSFEAACEIDPQDAELAYQAGIVALKLGDIAKAGWRLTQARDEDVCPLRAHSRIQEAVRSISSANDCRFIDYPKVVEDWAMSNGYGPIPGDECFLDHVHPTIELHFVLATEILRALSDAGHLALPDDWRKRAIQLKEERVKGLNSADHATALNNVAQVLSWAGKNVEALRVAVRAETLAPQDPDVVSQYGRLLEKANRQEEALAAYRRAVELEPQHPQALYWLGQLLLRRNEPVDAQRFLLLAWKNTPERAPRAFKIVLQESLAECYQIQGRTNEAMEWKARARSQ